MTIPRISADVEKPFRDALGHAIRNEFEEMREGLLRLTDEQIASCLNLCAIVAGYVAIGIITVTHVPVLWSFVIVVPVMAVVGYALQRTLLQGSLDRGTLTTLIVNAPAPSSPR